MLSGDVPFEADSAVSVALMQLQADAKKLTDINPDIPLGLEQICIRAMQKDPLDRYQTATEMLLDIEEIIKNPETTFNYVSKVDANPTKIVSTSEKKPAPEPVEETPDEDYYPDPNRKRKILGVVIVGLLVLIAAAVMLIMSVTSDMNKTSYKLEDFVGMSYDELKIANDNGAYKYEFIAEYEKTNEYAPGIIIDQSPAAGTKVMEGSQVTLIVAATADDITVPNVYGYTEEQAKTKLSSVGLINFTTVVVNSENVEEGKVVYTEPKANTVTSADKEVVIYLSGGPSTTALETVVIPDVKGLSQNDAKAFLEKYGFTNVSFVTEDSMIAKGIVLSQSPESGESVQVSDAIKVIVSSGVTTTTTQPAVNIGVTVRLPSVKDANGNYVKDTLAIKIDGETHTTKSVTLDGSAKSYTISVEGGKRVSIGISLSSTKAVDTKDADTSKTKSMTFDFSDFSRDDTTEAVSE